MKLLTINTHSLIEENYEEKLKCFIDAIIEEQPDVIAMQEVNQSRSAKVCDDTLAKGMVGHLSWISLRMDNHALRVAVMLFEAGIKYHWAWLPIKIGYGKYDEGLAIFSRQPIEETDCCLLSDINDYNDWKTRKVLGIKCDNQWFYTVHMGWWNDDKEPFRKQWERLSSHLSSKEKVWLLGDFNSQADVRNEGYDCVIASGWLDTYNMAKIKDDGATANKKIDGWKENVDYCSESLVMCDKMRIDYIWCNYATRIKSSKVIFNGLNREIVSDHFGVIVEEG